MVGSREEKATFPVIIVETLANFSFPSSSMLISKTFIPKKTRETNIAGRGGQGNVESSRCPRIPYFLE